MEAFEETVLRLAKQIDADLKPGNAIKIKEGFDIEYRNAVIKTLIDKYGYKQEIPYHVRKPNL